MRASFAAELLKLTWQHKLGEGLF